MYRTRFRTALSLGMLMILGCGHEQTTMSAKDMQTVRLKFSGFTKSKSGAT